jgi:hypothetical protein
MSMISTRGKHVSTCFAFVDMFFWCVHDVDMNKQTQTVEKLDAAIAANLEEPGMVAEWSEVAVEEIKAKSENAVATWRGHWQPNLYLTVG